MIKLKNYIKELPCKKLISHAIFYLSLSTIIYFYDVSLVCKTITWFFEFLLAYYIVMISFYPESIIQTSRKIIKKQNPILNGLNELIFLLFVAFLSYTKSWITLSLFIVGIVLTAIIFSYYNMNKKD